MKRDFLKTLGIEDKDIIDKILDENSSDIGRAKGELDTYKTKVTDLENEIKTKDDTIADLQKEADKVDGLNQTISQLQNDKNNFDKQIKEIKKDYAIDGAIREAKGVNVKAIKALLDMSKITYEDDKLDGISDQLTTLAQAEDSSMLFGKTQNPPPSGTHYNDPPSGGGSAPTSTTFAEAVAKALAK